MGFADWYFKRFSVSALCTLEPKYAPALVVVIPACNEPKIISTIQILWDAQLPDMHVAVLVIINHAENATAEIISQNKQTLEALQQFDALNSKEGISLHYCIQTFEAKNAGVGAARKFGMDTAVHWFNTFNVPKGIIASLDADVQVDPNYLIAVYEYFNSYPKSGAAVIKFAHPISGSEFSNNQYSAIVLYELYLRFFKLGLMWCGYPFPIHTIGSCFAVTANSYCKVGGMNRKQGGEDFYFLHKLTATTNIGEITNTCIYPSPRISNRVPFGTGPEVEKILNAGIHLTYQAKLFDLLKAWFALFPDFYFLNSDALEKKMQTLNPILLSFADTIGFYNIVADTQQQTSNIDSFVKRLFQHVNAFQIVKFLNFASVTYPKVPVCQAAAKMLQNYTIQAKENEIDMLIQYRKFEIN
jgi:hypothetical protein